jgi:hypothetical protein
MANITVIDFHPSETPPLLIEKEGKICPYSGAKVLQRYTIAKLRNPGSVQPDYIMAMLCLDANKSLQAVLYRCDLKDAQLLETLNTYKIDLGNEAFDITKHSGKIELAIKRKFVNLED